MLFAARAKLGTGAGAVLVAGFMAIALVAIVGPAQATVVIGNPTAPVKTSVGKNGCVASLRATVAPVSATNKMHVVTSRLSISCPEATDVKILRFGFEFDELMPDGTERFVSTSGYGQGSPSTPAAFATAGMGCNEVGGTGPHDIIAHGIAKTATTDLWSERTDPGVAHVAVLLKGACLR